jgi:hypothetical protein
MKKQIFTLQPRVIDEFKVYPQSDDYDPDDSVITWVYRYMSQGFRCYRFSLALKDMLNNYYFLN